MSDGEPQVFSHPHHVESLSKGNIHFVLKLYKQCVSEEVDNVLLSPFSISTSLAMAYVAARTETAGQIRELLRLSSVGDDVNVHAAFQDVLSSLRCTGNMTLHSANRIYAHDELKVASEFTRLLDKFYHAGVARFNFAHDSERSRLEMNHSVVDDTRWKVRDLIRRGFVNATTRLLAVSALYLKAEWSSKFKPMRTKPSPFHLGVGGRTVTVDMMQQRAEFRIAVCDEVDSTIVELPFRGQRLSMFVFLPREVSGMPLLESKLTADVLAAIFAGMRRARVTVTLPRFRLTSGYLMHELLAPIGLADLFRNGKADLGGVHASPQPSNDNLHVSSLLHKAFVDVNEDGTEAGAATAATFSTTNASSEPEIGQTFVADHPFLFMIRDNLSGMILFVGRLVAPSSK